MKHFINPELLAPNVLTVALDIDVVNEFVELARSEDPGSDYATIIPWPKLSDMRWISGATPKGFARFQSAYERLGLADHVRQYLDLDRDVRYYTGFLHTRGHCRESNFHVDWQLTNNEAFTVLTPLPGDDRPQRLLYQTMKGEIAEYVYKPGEGIVFGDHFTHASPVGTWDPPFTLLAFNFGTDKMEHWGKLLRTQGRQCPLVQQPNGEFMRVDPYKGAPATMVAPMPEAFERLHREAKGSPVIG